MSTKFLSGRLKLEPHIGGVNNFGDSSVLKNISLSPKKISFHIGPHKTATTSIQKMYVDNRKSLSDRGIYYPKKA